MKKIVCKLNPTYSLGDTIVSLNIIFNICKQLERSVILNIINENLILELMDIFDYEDRIILQTNKNKQYRPIFPFRIGNFINIGIDSKKYWCGHIRGFISERFANLRKFILPNHKLVKPQKREYFCYQVDSHSNFNDCKPKLKLWEIKNIIQNFQNEDSYFIGKVGTKKIFQNQKTHFNSLMQQAEFLLGCKKFFGIDSGMSHLAGTLGVDGDIILQQTKEHCINCVEKTYNVMYPQFRIHKKDELKFLFKV